MIDFTDNTKNKQLWEKIGKNFPEFIYQKIRWLLFLSLLMVAGYSFFLWYKYIYHPEWSDAKKQEYIKTKDNGVVMNKNRFQDIVKEYERRGVEYQKKIDPGQDIFRLKK